MITGYEDILPQMKNDAKDRHVLAAAIVGRVHVIVTDNIRHFPPDVLEPYGLFAQTADCFLVDQYHLDPDAFIQTLETQALETNRKLSDLLQLLSVRTPKLTKLVSG